MTARRVKQDLAFAGMPFFLASVELVLTVLRALIGLRPAKGLRRFGHVNHHHSGTTKALH